MNLFSLVLFFVAIVLFAIDWAIKKVGIGQAHNVVKFLVLDIEKGRCYYLINRGRLIK